MSDQNTNRLNEFSACNLLAHLFGKRGYSIERNLIFKEYGTDFHIDGWDKKARVGFEVLTSEDDDHDDLNLKEYKAISDAQQRGELAIFIVDEVEPMSEAVLLEEAEEFLNEIESGPALRKPRAATSSVKVNKKKTTQKNPIQSNTKKKAANVVSENAPVVVSLQAREMNTADKAQTFSVKREKIKVGIRKLGCLLSGLYVMTAFLLFVNKEINFCMERGLFAFITRPPISIFDTIFGPIYLILKVLEWI